MHSTTGIRLTAKVALMSVCAVLPVANAAAQTASAEDIAAFLGTTLEAIEAINPTNPAALPPEDIEPAAATRGSAMRITLDVQAGDTFSFDWFFGTDEGPNGADDGIIDFAFFSAGGSLSLLASVLDPLELAADGSPFDDQLPPLTEDGTDYFRNGTLTFSESGTFTIGFAVVDVSDTIVQSGLVIDNITLNGNLLGNGDFNSVLIDGDVVVFPDWESLGDIRLWDSSPVSDGGNPAALMMSGNFTETPVPVPATAWLLGSALAGLAWRRRR